MPLVPENIPRVTEIHNGIVIKHTCELRHIKFRAPASLCLTNKIAPHIPSYGETALFMIYPGIARPLLKKPWQIYAPLVVVFWYVLTPEVNQWIIILRSSGVILNASWKYWEVSCFGKYFYILFVGVHRKVISHAIKLLLIQFFRLYIFFSLRQLHNNLCNVGHYQHPSNLTSTFTNWLIAEYKSSKGVK